MLGMEWSSVYQVIYRNLTEVVGSYIMYDMWDNALFPFGELFSQYVYVLNNSMYQMNIINITPHL